MAQVTSKDGTVIAYTKQGEGPALIIVNGSVGYRAYHGDKELAEILAKKFTTVIYDRRGRGESSDTKRYTVEREIEDIEALIDTVGGKAFIYSVSSGAALALKAAAKLQNKIIKLAIFEPPYSVGDEARKAFMQLADKMRALHDANMRSEAVALYMSNFMPPEAIESFQNDYKEDWSIMEAVAPTLAYDYTALGDGTPPLDVIKEIKIPTLVMNGTEGLPYINESLEVITENLANAERTTLDGQPHEPAAEAMAPVLFSFFGD